MILLKEIDMTLDANSIGLAIKAIQDFRDYLGAAMSMLISQLTEQGVEFAKMELVMFPRPAVDTGELSDSIKSEVVSPKEGVVKAECEYAVYVEYGTGIIGKAEHHPEPVYEYDRNKHGVAGWVYKGRDGRFHRTVGMESRPFMYNTLRDLELFAGQNGGRIIAEYIP